MPTARITVTLPQETIEYADQLAQRRGKSRSAVVAEALKALRQAELERELAEGYQAMAAESRHFAREAMPLAAEVWPDYEASDGA